MKYFFKRLVGLVVCAGVVCTGLPMPAGIPSRAHALAPASVFEKDGQAGAGLKKQQYDMRAAELHASVLSLSRAGKIVSGIKAGGASALRYRAPTIPWLYPSGRSALRTEEGGIRARPGVGGVFGFAQILCSPELSYLEHLAGLLDHLLITSQAFVLADGSTIEVVFHDLMEDLSGMGTLPEDSPKRVQLRNFIFNVGMREGSLEPELRPALVSEEAVPLFIRLYTAAMAEDSESLRRAFLDMLRDEAQPISLRYLAAKRLSAFRDVRAVPETIEMLKSKYPGVRMAAVEALALHKDKRAMAGLTALQGDASQPEAMRQLATQALGRILLHLARPDKRPRRPVRALAPGEERPIHAPTELNERVLDYLDAHPDLPRRVVSALQALPDYEDLKGGIARYYGLVGEGIGFAKDLLAVAVLEKEFANGPAWTLPLGFDPAGKTDEEIRAARIPLEGPAAGLLEEAVVEILRALPPSPSGASGRLAIGMDPDQDEVDRILQKAMTMVAGTGLYARNAKAAEPITELVLAILKWEFDLDALKRIAAAVEVMIEAGMFGIPIPGQVGAFGPNPVFLQRMTKFLSDLAETQGEFEAVDAFASLVLETMGPKQQRDRLTGEEGGYDPAEMKKRSRLRNELFSSELLPILLRRNPKVIVEIIVDLKAIAATIAASDAELQRIFLEHGFYTRLAGRVRENNTIVYKILRTLVKKISKKEISGDVLDENFILFLDKEGKDYEALLAQPHMQTVLQEGVLVGDMLTDFVGNATPANAPEVLSRILEARDALVADVHEGRRDIRDAESFTDTELAYLYSHLRRRFPRMLRPVLFTHFRAHMRGDTQVRQGHAFERLIQTEYTTEKIYLGAKDKRVLTNMSLDLHYAVKKIIADAGRANDPDSVITFREFMRFNVDFTRYYLSRQETGYEDLMQAFIITATNIYGGILATEEEREEFKQTLLGLVDEAQNPEYFYFIGLSMELSDALEHIPEYVEGESIAEKMINYYSAMGTYEYIHGIPEDKLGGIRLYQEAFVRLTCAQETQRPILFLRSPQAAHAVDEALEELAKDSGGEVFHFTMTPFSKRGELLGMHMPIEVLPEGDVAVILEQASQEDIDTAIRRVLNLGPAEDADPYREHAMAHPTARMVTAMAIYHGERYRDKMRWSDGLLERIKARAEQEPDKPFYLVFDNIEAAESKFRITFNPILWEKQINVPELNLTIKMPRNMHFVFTADKDSEISDAAFYDRPLRVHLDEMGSEDLMRLLARDYPEMTEEVREFFSAQYAALRQADWDYDYGFSPHDILRVAAFTMGRADSPKEALAIAREEFGRYFHLRLRSHEDRKAFEKLYEGHWQAAHAQPDLRLVAKEGVWHLQADGVSMPVGPELEAFIQGHPQWVQDPDLLILRFGDLILRRQDKRVIGQLLRAMKYLQGPFVRLEGPSGEGKTYLVERLAGLLGKRPVTNTIYFEKDLRDFRGGNYPDNYRRYYLNQDTELLRAFRDGNAIVVNSELNTGQGQGLFWWYYPVAKGHRKRLLSEYPKSHAKGFFETALPPDNLYVADINPDDFSVREPVPPELAGLSASYWMGYDYNADDQEYLLEIREETRDLVVQLFRRHFKIDDIAPHAGDIALVTDAWIAMQRGLADQTIQSTEQVLTMRELQRAIRHMAEGKTPAQALTDNWVFLWREARDQLAAAKILAAANVAPTTGRSPLAALHEALGKKQPHPDHLLVYSSQRHDAAEEVMAELGRHAGVQTHYLPLSQFTRPSHLLGHFVPAKEVPEPTDAWGRALQEWQPNLQMGVGMLLRLVRSARLDEDKDRRHVALLDNYHRLAPETAVLLNKVLQEGVLEIGPEILTKEVVAELMQGLERRGRLKQFQRKWLGRDPPLTLNEKQRYEFTRWFYATMPSNLQFVAVGHAAEEMPMSPAELSRLVNFSLDASFTTDTVEEIVREYVADKFRNRHMDRFVGAVTEYIAHVDELFWEQQEQGIYPHNRLGIADIHRFLARLDAVSADWGRPDKAQVERALHDEGYAVLAIGLRDQYRKKVPKAAYSREARFVTRDGQVYLELGGVQFATRHASLADAHAPDYLATLEGMVDAERSMLLAFAKTPLVILEGPPGAGKTAMAQDVSKRMGWESRQFSMYTDVDLSDFVGRVAKRGIGRYVLTGRRGADNKFLVDFLRMYEEGGVFVLDEGAIGDNAKAAIAWLIHLVHSDRLDIAAEGGATRTLQRHKDFKVVISQNPADVTSAREDIPVEIDHAAQKVWVSDAFSKDDYLLLIDHYLAGRPLTNKEKLIAFHQKILEMQKGIQEVDPDRFPHQRVVTNRELIRWVRTIADLTDAGYSQEEALFQGLMLHYLAQYGNPRDLREIWEETVASVFEKSLNVRRMAWMRDVAADARGRIGGIAIPRPATIFPGVPAGGTFEDLRDLNSQMLAMKNLMLSMAAQREGQPSPTLLMAEDGAMPLDVLKQLAHTLRYQLHVLDGHAQMSSTHLRGALLPQFEEFLDEQGIKRETMAGEVRLALGFLTRHLVPEGQSLAPEDVGHKILVLNNLDVIPEKVRTLLNDFLLSGKIRLEAEDGSLNSFVLPPSVHVVGVMPVESDAEFTSAFLNRFRRVGLSAVNNPRELRTLITAKYPGLTKDEIGLMGRIVRVLTNLDTAEGFKYKYGFNMKDTLYLAELVAREKEKDAEAGKRREYAWEWVLKGALLLFGSGVDEAVKVEKQSDWQRFVEEVLYHERTFGRLEGFDETRIKDLTAEISAMERAWHQAEVQVPVQNGQMVKLPNGISLLRHEDKWILKTPANEYFPDLDTIAPGQRWELSPGLAISRPAISPSLRGIEEAEAISLAMKTITIETNLIASIGGEAVAWEHGLDKNQALPPEEVAEGEFIKHVPAVNRVTGLMLRSWRATTDARGRTRRTKVVSAVGDTGTAKTTNAKNIARILGVPLFVLNSHEELKVSDMTAELRVNAQAGGYEVGVKEFLQRLGKVNGRHLSGWDARQKKILLIDEANTNADVLYALAPLFRGEKEFTVEYAGERFDVEVDDEVLVLLTLNPLEDYSGRDNIGSPLLEDAVKLWMPNPELFPRHELFRIGYALHERKIGLLDREERREIAALEASAEPAQQLAPAPTLRYPVLPHAIVAAEGVAEKGFVRSAHRHRPGVPESEEDEGQFPVPIKHIHVSYDKDRIAANLEDAMAESDEDKRIELFFYEIMPEYFNALAHRDGAEFNARVLTLARSVSASVDSARAAGTKPLEKLIEDIQAEYRRSKPSKVVIKNRLRAMRRLFIHKKLFWVIFVSKPEGKKQPYVHMFPNSIRTTIGIPFPGWEELGDAIVLEDGNGLKDSGKLGYFDGEFAIADGSKLQDHEWYWTAYHELAHKKDKVEDREPHNKELNAMLSPLMWAHDADLYMRNILIPLLRYGQDVNSYYFQAAKGIINALGILREERAENRGEAIEKFQPVTDELPQDLVEKAVAIAQAMDAATLNAMARTFYDNPQYMESGNKGRYLIQPGSAAGAVIEELMVGMDGKVKMEIASGPKEQTQVDFDQDEGQDALEEGESEAAQEEKDEEAKGEVEIVGEIPDMPTGEGEGEEEDEEGWGDLDPERMTVRKASTIARWLQEMGPEARKTAKQLLNIFRGKPKKRTRYEESGEEIDIQRDIEGSLEPFKVEIIIPATAELAMGVLLDTSGSMSGNMKKMIRMIRYYLAVMHMARAAVKGKKRVDYFLGELKDHYIEHIHLRQNATEGDLNSHTRAMVSSLGGIVGTVAVANVIKEFEGNRSKNKLALIFTDGEDTDKDQAKLDRLMAKARERGIDIVAIGLDAPYIEEFDKFISLPKDPTLAQLNHILMKLAQTKATGRGNMLPLGDLGPLVGVPPIRQVAQMAHRFPLHIRVALKAMLIRDHAHLGLSEGDWTDIIDRKGIARFVKARRVIEREAKEIFRAVGMSLRAILKRHDLHVHHLDAVVDFHERFHEMLHREQWRHLIPRTLELLQSRLGPEGFEKLRAGFENNYGSTDSEEEFIEELIVNYYQEYMLFGNPIRTLSRQGLAYAQRAARRPEQAGDFSQKIKERRREVEAGIDMLLHQATSEVFADVRGMVLGSAVLREMFFLAMGLKIPIDLEDADPTEKILEILQAGDWEGLQDYFLPVTDFVIPDVVSLWLNPATASRAQDYLVQESAKILGSSRPADWQQEPWLRRRSALRRNVMRHAGDLVPVLMRELRQSDEGTPEERWAKRGPLAELLWAIGDARAVPLFKEIFEKETWAFSENDIEHLRLRDALLKGLVKMQGTQALEFLGPYTRGRKPIRQIVPSPSLQGRVVEKRLVPEYGRRWIIYAIGHMQHPDAVAFLAKLVKPQYRADMREAIATALGFTGQSEAEGPLRVLLKDAHPDTKIAAANALGDIGGVGAMGELRELTRHREFTVRVAAAQALAQLLVLRHDEAAFAALVRVAEQDTMQAAREGAAQALSQYWLDSARLKAQSLSESSL